MKVYEYVIVREYEDELTLIAGPTPIVAKDDDEAKVKAVISVVSYEERLKDSDGIKVLVRPF